VNLYEVLGVPRDADLKTITRAYRKLARKHHPDANPGDSDAAKRFHAVQEAFDVLGDAAGRAEYDRTGAVPRNGPQVGFDIEILNIVKKHLFDLLRMVQNAPFTPGIGRTDVPEQVRARIRVEIEQLENWRKIAIRDRDHLVSVAGRFEKDGNIMVSILEQEIRGINTGIEENKRQIAKMKEAIEQTTAIVYRQDEGSPQPLRPLRQIPAPPRYMQIIVEGN
jgi:curved DNA-binding protein CbpA